jgi:tetratricopeptide (TPR) repeat protein
MAWNAKEMKNWPDAARFLEKALAIRRAVGDRRGEGMALGLLGDVAKENNRFAAARTHYQAALALNEQVGNRQLITLLREALQTLDETGTETKRGG